MTFLDEIELLGRLGPIKLSILVTHKGKRVIGNFVTLASRRMVTPLTESRLLEVRHLKKINSYKFILVHSEGQAFVGHCSSEAG